MPIQPAETKFTKQPTRHKTVCLADAGPERRGRRCVGGDADGRRSAAAVQRRRPRSWQRTKRQSTRLNPSAGRFVRGVTRGLAAKPCCAHDRLQKTETRRHKDHRGERTQTPTLCPPRLCVSKFSQCTPRLRMPIQPAETKRTKQPTRHNGRFLRHRPERSERCLNY